MACGLAGLLTVDVEGPGLTTPEHRIFGQPFALVGRDDRADLVLDHDHVSRRHLFLQVIGGRAFFLDLDSRTGTSLGGDALESGWVAPGQSLIVGPYRLRVSVDAAADHGPDDPEPPNPLLARSSARAPGLPKVSLEFQSRTAGHSVWRMGQVMALVGGSPRCKVRLLDSNVSKLHCAMLRTAGGLWVVDLLSREGITVNGLSVRSSRLRPGDVLGLGHVSVRANFETATPGPIPAAGWGVPPDAPGGFSFGAGLPERQPARPWEAAPPAQEFAPPAFPAGPSLPPAANGAPDPALSMLLGHFGQMQQQMLDQFQQSMFMMLQMFSGMHREQMGLMREELERLRDLNVEMATIKAEIMNRQGKISIPVPPPAPPGRPANGHHLSTANDPPRGPSKDQTPPADAPAPAPAAPSLEPSVDVHDWLNDRLNAITDEQQSRWQRIMNIVRGDK